MIYRFEIITDTDERYEEWAHNPDEMREKFRSAFPTVRGFEVFLSRIPFENLTFNMYQDCVAAELPEMTIAELDRKIGKLIEKWRIA